MIYLLQRLIINSYAWTKPSPGRLGPTGEGEYVKENGFGHEDWNFNHDLAINGYIYGYAYYEPAPKKQTEQFQFAFASYRSPNWHLVGFYLDAQFAPDGAPISDAILNEKKRHLLELKKWKSLGKSWSSLGEDAIFTKLTQEAQSLHWRVNSKDAVRLPVPIEIPKNLYKTKNYHLTKPEEINDVTFTALRQLASENVLPEDDEAAFPEGRELFLKHRARERNPRVIEHAKNLFFQKHGRFFCEVCGFEFEKVYGELGRGFIEAHHTIPVSALSEGSETKARDIAMVCPNCHRMLHRKRPWLAIDELKSILKH